MTPKIGMDSSKLLNPKYLEIWWENFLCIEDVILFIWGFDLGVNFLFNVNLILIWVNLILSLFK